MHPLILVCHGVAHEALANSLKASHVWHSLDSLFGISEPSKYLLSEVTLTQALLHDF